MKSKISKTTFQVRLRRSEMNGSIKFNQEFNWVTYLKESIEKCCNWCQNWIGVEGCSNMNLFHIFAVLQRNLDTWVWVSWAAKLGFGYPHEPLHWLYQVSVSPSFISNILIDIVLLVYRCQHTSWSCFQRWLLS